MNTFEGVAKEFEPISLEEMDRVALMDRKEIKFIFSTNQLADILSNVTGKYQILEIDKMRVFLYNTTYLDTCDYHYHRESLRGKLNTFKIRYRVYASTGGSYLEIKCKSNKMRTVKWRIKNAQLPDVVFDEQAESFLHKHLGNNSKLMPVLHNNFNRITLVGNGFNERVTLDFNISFSEINGEKNEVPFLTIAEIKYDNTLSNSPFFKTLKDLQIRPTGFSKYCMGNVIVKNTNHSNILKPKFLTLNKIKNDFLYSTFV